MPKGKNYNSQLEALILILEWNDRSLYIADMNVPMTREKDVGLWGRAQGNRDREQILGWSFHGYFPHRDEVKKFLVSLTQVD